MVEKISVNIKVLSLNTEYNFLIPKEMCVGEAISLVVQILLDEYPGMRVSRLSNYRLMHILTGKILDQGCSFQQLGIVQGEKLLLI